MVHDTRSSSVADSTSFRIRLGMCRLCFVTTRNAQSTCLLGGEFLPLRPDVSLRGKELPRSSHIALSPFQDSAIHCYIMTCHVTACVRSEKDASSPNVIWLSNPSIHNLIFPTLQQMWEGCYTSSADSLLHKDPTRHTCHLRANIAW